MVTSNHKYLLGMANLLVIAGLGFFFLETGSQNEGTYYPPFNTPLGMVSINAELPDSPSNITLYRVVPSEHDMASFVANHLVDERPDVPSEAEAPLAAEKALIPYGGLPHGAKLVYVKTEYMEEFDTQTKQVTERISISTNVQYTRYIDNRPVVGDGGSIYLDLGNFGEIVYLNKVWRNVTPAGTIPIISASEAVDKMKRGDLFGHQPRCNCQLNVNKIGLGYYEKGKDEVQEYLEPVWIFSGMLSSGDTWRYYVYARKSSATPMAIVSDASQFAVWTSGAPENNPSNKNPTNSELMNTTENTGNFP